MSAISSPTTPNQDTIMPSIDSTILPSAGDVAQHPQSKTVPLMHWKERAALKRHEQAARIPLEWRLNPTPSPLPTSTLEYIENSSLLTALEHQITSILDATTLLAKIKSREVTAVEVATAFCKRAAIAQQLSGCCTEMFFEKAIKRAEELDRHLTETGEVVGPFHGLPVSLKDGTDVEGEDSTLGWVGLCGKPAKVDCLLAECLRKQGAVLYCKTNIPQSLMMSDSYNHVFKQSLNSLNRALISGGSSGGEGALVGCHGSIVGVGTDIGGSIRIPANLQGLYGLSPTVGRFPWHPSVIRDNIVNGVAGPLTSSLDTLEVFMRGLLQAEPWNYEPTSHPIPWRDALAQKPTTRKLRIGYYTDDGMVKVQPPISRAVNEVITALRYAGHDVFEWNVSTHIEGQRLWTRAILADGGRKCARLCEDGNEPLVPGMLVGKESDRLTVNEANEVDALRLSYQKTYMRRLVDENVDAIICPVQPWVGFKPKTWVQSHQNVSYTSHWNWVDFAALVVPVTHARREDVGDEDWKEWKPRDKSDEFNWRQYEPKLVEGMPVGVQIVGGRFGEERCVAVARVVEEVLRGKGQ